MSCDCVIIYNQNPNGAQWAKNQSNLAEFSITHSVNYSFGGLLMEKMISETNDCWEWYSSKSFQLIVSISVDNMAQQALSSMKFKTIEIHNFFCHAVFSIVNFSKNLPEASLLHFKWINKLNKRQDQNVKRDLNSKTTIYFFFYSIINIIFSLFQCVWIIIIFFATSLKYL